MKPLEQIDKEFTELLLSDPKHWFAEYSSSISLNQKLGAISDPISYALYQSFCIHYSYEFGKFDLTPEKDRLVTYINEKGKKITFSERWGCHPDDYKILRPIFYREKEKYILENGCSELNVFRKLTPNINTFDGRIEDWLKKYNERLTKKYLKYEL